MAWTGTTTQYQPKLLAYDTCKLVSTTLTQLTSMGSTDATGVGAGMIRLTTHSDVVQFPFYSANGKMVIFGQMLSPDTSLGYIMTALRYPMSSDNIAWQSGKIVSGASTQNYGWHCYWTTNFVAGTSHAIAFVAGPFDNARYGHNMGTSSTTFINKGQSYIEAVFMVTTAGDSTTVVPPTLLTAASSSRSELFNICAFELP